MIYLRFFAYSIKRLKRKKAFWLPASLLYWLMPVFYVLELECFHKYPKYFLESFLADHISILIFDLILVYVLFAALFFLIQKAWMNILLFNALILAVSFVNYIKYALTGENFMPHDIIMATNMGEIAGFVSIEIEFWSWLFIAVSIVSAIFLGIFAKDAPLKFYVRLPVASALFLVLFIFFGNGALSGDLFNEIGMYFESTDNQITNYEANGFIGGFSINLASFAIKKPEGYSSAKLQEALGEYAEIFPSADFANPDIVLILSESFWDPKLLPESEITPNPLENYDELKNRENAFAGKLVVPTYGGGTIRTEFEILTGLACDALPDGVVPYTIIKKDVISYVSYYKELGYDTIAIHPYLAKFYRRDTGLPFLGFDAYYAESLAEIKEIKPEIVGESYKYVTDRCFARYLEYFLDEAEKKDAAPLFLFGISIENHQPYYYKYYWETFTVRAKNPRLSKNDYHFFENYVQGVKNADEALGQLCNFIDSRNRPTAIVFFGDHLPSICSKYSAYLDTGFISDIYATDSRLQLYSTPFIIYANFPLDKKGLQNDAYASYDLLNVLSSLIGSGKTQYMGYLEALREILPYYNIKLKMEITKQQQELLKIQYYETYKRMTN
ncbi:MAG: LTA synthase family protein [Oscillospiraceae bacterium]|nr:LTA synthase family protein [Oscillospiraceae bacterium]